MRIGNYFDHSQIYNDYSSLKVRESLAEIRKPEEVKAAEDTAAAAAQQKASEEENAVKRERLLGLEDISITFNKNDDFDIIGRTSDITDLDLQKAVSISKKDDILTGYKAAENALPVYAGEEGTVIAK
ncbi:MAG: hypothetical protein K6F65_06365 [Lachnospiraceae bacterium]|nr:hypothetical protein [Lachnospiraceae bacterium]